MTVKDKRDSKLEFLRWYDAHSSDMWREVSEFTRDEFECYSVGFVVFENDFYVEVASTVSYNEVCSSMCIPKVSIIERIVMGIPQNDIPDDLTENITL